MCRDCREEQLRRAQEQQRELQKRIHYTDAQGRFTSQWFSFPESPRDAFFRVLNMEQNHENR